jgi:hypothetical protein
MINPMFIGDAINAVCPNATWSLDEPFEYENLIWRDEVLSKPSKEAVMVEAARLQAEYEAKQYQRERASAYPSIQEQLDLLYWDKVNGTDNWEQAIAAVKAEYPKG